MMQKNSHCSYCGARFAEDGPWPRRCAACANVSYLNPLPVAVLLQPVDDGLLVIRRAIAPVGRLALPGGFIDVGESWQAAAARYRPVQERLFAYTMDVDPNRSASQRGADAIAELLTSAR